MATQPGLSLSLTLLALVLATTCNAHSEATATDQKHFVLVHGLGHGAWCWYKITTLLQQAGHRATTIDLASNGINKQVADSITSVSQYLQPLTQLLASTNHKVILVGHSLGGSSITYAMEQFPEKIEKAVFLAAFMPANNETFVPAYALQALGFVFLQGNLVQNFGNGPSSPATSISSNLQLAKDFFYNRSPPEDVSLALTLLTPTPAAPLAEVLKLTPSRYGSIPRFYLRTPFDNVIPPAVQASILQQNPPQEEVIIEGSDHSAFFSQSAKLASVLLSIASSHPRHNCQTELHPQVLQTCFDSMGT